MRYQEAYPKGILFFFIIAAAFLFMYFPWHLGLRELLGGEGRYAAIAIEMNLFEPTTVAHNALIPYYYPLYPWIVAILYKLGFSLEIGLRIVSIISLAGLCYIVFQTTRSITGIYEALVAFSIMSGSIIVCEKAIDGDPFILAVLFLYLAWLTWYNFGFVKGSWNKAWLVSTLFCGLAFYTIGWIAFAYYILPLIFMRRPLTVWKKLECGGFKLGLLILIFFILLWIIPRLTLNEHDPISTDYFISNLNQTSLSDYLSIPLIFCFSVMPWLPVIWPAFCVAYYPLDKNPIFSRLLRTITMTLFVFLWLNPLSDKRDFILLIPALAIMGGINYQVLIRRHGNVIHWIYKIIVIGLCLLSAMLLFLFLIPEHWWHEFLLFRTLQAKLFENGIGFFHQWKLQGIFQLAIAICISITLLVYHKKDKLPVWLHGLCICVIMMSFFWAVIYPYRSSSNDGRRTSALIIKDLGTDYSKDMILYKDAKIADIYVLGCYLGCKIKRVNTLNQIPSDQNPVFLFSLDPPTTPDRQWTQVSAQYYREKVIYLWKGVLVLKKPSLDVLK